ncbi:MAG: thymidine kinase [Rhizobiaceae bacterium]
MFVLFAINGLMAKLYFHYSTMNAGKSTALLQASYNYRERGMSTMLFIAALDDRAGRGRIGSRIGLSADANIFGPNDDLYTQVAERHAASPVHCVFVDEAQFLTDEQVWQLARLADRQGVPVMCYGLRVDFQGQLFPGSKALLALADDLREIRTICRCGRKATMVVRLGPDGKVLHQGAQVEIGGEDKYVSLCRRHWEEEMGRWPAEDMIGYSRA